LSSSQIQKDLRKSRVIYLGLIVLSVGTGIPYDDP